MAFKLLNSVTLIGESNSIPFRKITKGHTIQIDITGAPTAITVDLEGSLNNTTWAVLITSPMSAAELTAAVSLSHIEDKPVRYIRVNLTTLTGGSSPTVTVLYEAFEHRN